MILIILIIIIVAVFVAKGYADKAQAEKLERERIEKKKKAEAYARAQKAKYEVLTEAEKEILSEDGEERLTVTLNAFDAAVKGDAEAMLLMALTYQACIRDEKKSFYWMQKASKAGDMDATYWLGEFYVSGYGVTENRTRGIMYIMDAAKKGNERAIQALKENGMSIAQMRSMGIPV